MKAKLSLPTRPAAVYLLVVLDILVSMRAEEGATLVLVTHDPVVAGLADRRIHLLDGRIEREETG